MKKEGKAVIIDKLEESFSKSSVGILTNYKGLKTVDLLERKEEAGLRSCRYRLVFETGRVVSFTLKLSNENKIAELKRDSAGE